MPNTAKELLEQENRPGNEEDGLSTGQQDYDEKFNHIARQSENEDFEDIISRNFNGENEQTDSHGDQVQKNYNADEPTKNIDAVRDQEEASSLFTGKGSTPLSSQPARFNGRIGGFVKKRGPSVGIIGLLLGGALFSAGGVSLTGSLLINFKEIFHNDRSDATRTNRLFSRAHLSNKFNNNDACGKISIKCKLGSMSKSQMKAYRDQGFKITGAEIGPDGKETGKRAEEIDKTSPEAASGNERYRVESIEFPDGFEAKSGSDFHSHTDNNVDARRVSTRAFNSRASFYLNKFFSQNILKTIGFSKGQKSFPTDEDKAAQDKEFNKQSGGLTEEEVENGGLKSESEKLTNQAESDTKSRSAAKGGAAVEAMRIVCLSYKMGRAGVSAVKIYHYQKLARFGLMFLQAADEIKRGSGDGPKVTYLSDNLTSYDPNEKMTQDDDTLGVKKGDPNPKYNLSASDSQGYRIAAHGDQSKLQDFAKKYVLGGGKLTSGISNFLDSTDKGVAKATFASSAKEGRQRIVDFCRTINSGPAVLAAACAGLPLALQAIGTSAPGLGNLAGAIGGLAICSCTAKSTIINSITDRAPALGSVFDFINGLPIVDMNTGGCDKMEKAAQILQEGAMKVLKSQVVQSYVSTLLEEINVGSDTKGVDAGNAIGAGVGLMLSKTATGYGLKPASSADDNQEITNYISYSQPLEDKYVELAKDDARHDPFDISNEFSFAGHLARTLNLSAITPKSLYGNLTALSTVLPTAIQSLASGSPVNALYNQPSTASDGKSERFDCADEDLEYIGAAGDKFCSIVGVTPTIELQAASDQASNKDSKEINSVIDYMTTSQSKDESQGGTGDNTRNCQEDNGCERSKGRSIDDNGKPLEDSQYTKYLTYCTEAREYPWGEQKENYEVGSDKDQDWFSGRQCMVNSTMMHNFRKWTNYCLQSATADGTSTCYEEDSTPAAAANTGSWVIPTTGPCLSPFGPRGGSLHAGLDISPPQGTPIVAPTSMKIISAGDKGDAYGYSVVARATDGTNHMFRFAHMANQPPVQVGQTVAKGSNIGVVGSTGDSSGPHLHFEIYAPGTPDGAYASNGSPVDPVSVLKDHGVSITCNG